GWAFDGHQAFAGGEEQTNYEINALATARGRIGWLPSESALVYVTGGAGWLHTTLYGPVGPAATFSSAAETPFRCGVRRRHRSGSDPEHPPQGGISLRRLRGRRIRPLHLGMPPEMRGWTWMWRTSTPSASA